MRLPKHIWLLVLVLLAIFLLRVPSFFEPYWYGDEGIYLALGQAMSRGAILYRDIWDNKPPLLYLIYALHPTLLWAKISATVFVLGTCVGVYILSKRLFQDKWSTVYSLLTTVLVGVFLSIPLFEGTIANAELYFTLPIVWSAYLFFRLKGPQTRGLKLIVIGFLMSAAFLLKVPAIFDFVGMFVAFTVIVFVDSGGSFVHRIVSIAKMYLPIFLIFVVCLLATVGYFHVNHALSDFLIASFSQNASYVAVGSGPLSKLSNPLFVKAIILALSSGLLVIVFWSKKISKELFFLMLWFGFSLYGSLLSNRPYMHYLLQLIPPAAILLIYVVAHLNKYFWVLGLWLLVGFYLVKMFTGAFALPTPQYYQNWFDFISERKLWDDYVNWFDPRTLNSYQVSDYIKKLTGSKDPVFVWGDAAFVYVLSDRPPATKFIQAHHLTTIDPVNYSLVIQKLKLVRPKYILISRPVHFQFPMLEALMRQNYQEVAFFKDLHVYRLSRPAPYLAN